MRVYILWLIINKQINTKQKTGAAKHTVYYYESRRNLLGKYWTALTDRHEKLIDFRKEYEANDYFTKDGYVLVESAYADAVAELRSDIDDLRNPDPNLNASNIQPVAVNNVRQGLFTYVLWQIKGVGIL